MHVGKPNYVVFTNLQMEFPNCYVCEYTILLVMIGQHGPQGPQRAENHINFASQLPFVHAVHSSNLDPHSL